MAKSTARGPAIDPTFMAANNAYLALKHLKKDKLDIAAALLSQRLGIQVGTGGQPGAGAGSGNGGARGQQGTTATPGDAKAFVASKATTKEIERVTVYAYYLVHHDDKEDFNGKDVDAFRKTVRGPAFSNIAVHMDNATKAGYLTSIGSGKKGITARGEAVVAALPDRAAVNAALETHPLRGRRPKKRAKKARGGG